MTNSAAAAAAGVNHVCVQQQDVVCLPRGTHHPTENKMKEKLLLNISKSVQRTRKGPTNTTSEADGNRKKNEFRNQSANKIFVRKRNSIETREGRPIIL